MPTLSVKDTCSPSRPFLWMRADRHHQNTMFITIVNYVYLRHQKTILPMWDNATGVHAPAPVKKNQTRPFSTADIFNAVASRTARRHYIINRNLFQDNLDRVLPLLHERAFDMKEKRARAIFSSMVIPSIAIASMDMKEKRARRVMREVVTPTLLIAASTVLCTRESKRALLPEVEKVGRTKSTQRVLLAHVLQHEVAPAISARLARARARQNYRAIVLEDLMSHVFHKEALRERLRYASILERIMHEIRERPVSQKMEKASKNSPLDKMFSTPFVLIGIFLLTFWIASCVMLFYMAQFLHRFFFHDVPAVVDGVVDLLERAYIISNPPVSRQQRRQKMKMEAKLMKKHLKSIKNV